MNGKVKNMMIGLFVLAACGMLIWFILFLKPSVGDGKETLYVRFSTINQIGVGTRVLYAGRPVGEVVAVHEIPNARDEPTDALCRFYFYQLTLKVDSSVQVFNTDEVTIQTTGLLGEKSIAIIPKAPPKGVTPKIVTTQPIYADSIDPLENTMHKLSELSDSMNDTFTEATKWLRDNGNTLACAIQSFGQTMDEARITMHSINENHLIEGIHEGIGYFNGTMKQIDETITQFREDGTFTNLSTMIYNFKNASHSIDIIAQDIADGKGTIGRLVKDDDLYLQVTAIMSKADTLMNDINHYGLLFHLNKSWQRMRTQRVNLLDALDTPDSFTTYFENEIDQINTAMARISMLVQKADKSPEKEEIMQSTPFRNDFAELLRKVDELSDNLKLYNEQLYEERLKEGNN